MLSTVLLLPPLLAACATQEPCMCTSIQPCFIGTINSVLPDGMGQFSGFSSSLACDANSPAYGFGEKDVTTVYKDWQGVDGGLDVSVDTIIEFENIPDDAHGCELLLTFAEGFNKIHDFGGLPTTFHVWHVDKAVDGNLTWNNAPKPTVLFGVGTDLKLPKEGDDYISYVSEETKKIGQSGCSRRCDNKMTFRVSVPACIKNGGIEFRQEQNPFGGWVLRYNC